MVSVYYTTFLNSQWRDTPYTPHGVQINLLVMASFTCSVKCCLKEGGDEIDGGADDIDFKMGEEITSSVQHIRVPLPNKKSIKFR